MRHHIVITGTGRTGTTFLVQLLTELGLDTGFQPNDLATQHYDKNARAGLEQDIRNDHAPYIIKSPWFCDHANEVLERSDIVIDHVFIPVRDLEAAAESRRHVVNSALKENLNADPNIQTADPQSFPGGLWHTSSTVPGEQEEVLLKQLYKLLLVLSDSMIPVTLMHFPRIVKDCHYLFEKLQPVLRDIHFEIFQEAFNKTVRPDIVHRFNDKDC